MCVERAESLSTAFSHAVLAMARNRDSPMSWVALALCMTTMHLDHSLIVDALEFDLVDMAVKCIMEETNSDVRNSSSLEHDFGSTRVDARFEFTTIIVSGRYWKQFEFAKN